MLGTIVAFVVVAGVSYVLYVMTTKKETIQQAVAETIADAEKEIVQVEAEVKADVIAVVKKARLTKNKVAKNG